MKILKYKILRYYIKLTRAIRKKVERIEDLDIIQTKAISLYYIYLKDNDSLINCSFISKKRHIQKDDVLMILGPGLQGSVLTVIDENSETSINCYEVLIPNYYYDEMTYKFDEVMEKRLRIAEKSKKEVITKDLDKLILKAKTTVDMENSTKVGKIFS